MKFLFLCVSLIFVDRGYSQDFIFPKDEEASYLSGNNPVITERIPVYIPMRCPENMLLYPGSGDKSTWMCDCKPGFLYFPLNETCHEAYRQGSCPSGNYVYLPVDNAVPICTANPCLIDGLVPYNGICQELGTTGGFCNQDVLRVNSRTYELECQPLTSSITRFIAAPVAPCPNGTRRLPSGGCGMPLR